MKTNIKVLVQALVFFLGAAALSSCQKSNDAIANVKPTQEEVSNSGDSSVVYRPSGPFPHLHRHMRKINLSDLTKTSPTE